MRNVFIVFIIFILTNKLIAQKTVTAKLTDMQTGKPVSYAAIELKSNASGTYTDTLGLFSLSISQSNINDSLEIYALGYKKKKIAINRLINTSNSLIKLEQKDILIKEVKVKPKNVKPVKLGVKAKKPWKYQIANIFGAQIAQYIRNDNHVSGFIRSVSFYITEVGHTNTPFRVRIYGYDKANNCPGEDLLNKDLIVQNTHGAGWFTVDILDYYIRFPEDGMFVAMEWVYTNDKYYYTHEITVYGKDGSKKVIMNSFYGLSLGNISKQKNIGVWSTRLGDKWIKWDQYYKGYINVMINAEIEVEK